MGVTDGRDLVHARRVFPLIEALENGTRLCPRCAVIRIVRVGKTIQLEKKLPAPTLVEIVRLLDLEFLQHEKVVKHRPRFGIEARDVTSIEDERAYLFER